MESSENSKNYKFYNELYRTFQWIASLAEKLQTVIKKTCMFSMIAAVLLVYAGIQLFGLDENKSFLPYVFLSSIPILYNIWIYYLLYCARCLPEDLEDTKNQINQLSPEVTSVTDALHDVNEEYKQEHSSQKKNISLKGILTFTSELNKLKAMTAGTAVFDLIATVLVVVNPIFAIKYITAIAMTIIWCLVALLMMIIQLFV